MTHPDFTLERNPFGRLVLTTADGTQHVGVVPVRAFPVVAPNEGLSLVNTDGHEAAWIARLDALPAPLRTLLDEELATREFVPQVRRLPSTLPSPSRSPSSRTTPPCSSASFAA